MKFGLIGATGLVGQHALQQMLDDPDIEQVVVWARSPADRQHSKLRWHQTDFEQLSEQMDCQGLDALLCALGTTQAKAGKDGLKRVDHDYVVAAAQQAKAAGVERFALVSALGASLRSPSFYSRVKAQAEQAVNALNFPSVSILRPSLLLGERAEHRSAEALGQKMAPVLNALLPGPLKAYRAIEGADVARAMILVAKRGQPGSNIFTLPLD